MYIVGLGKYSVWKNLFPQLQHFFLINKGNTKSHGHSKMNFKYVTSVIALSHINAYYINAGLCKYSFFFIWRKDWVHARADALRPFQCFLYIDTFVVACQNINIDNHLLFFYFFGTI